MVFAFFQNILNVLENSKGIKYVGDSANLGDLGHL